MVKSWASKAQSIPKLSMSEAFLEYQIRSHVFFQTVCHLLFVDFMWAVFLLYTIKLFMYKWDTKDMN